MNLQRIKELISKIEARDLQSFDNDLMQFWHELEKYDKSKSVFEKIEKDFKDINFMVHDFYEKMNRSSNKRKYIDRIINEAAKDFHGKPALGLFLLREEINQEVIGYNRVITYWFTDLSCENKYTAKKLFIEHILKPIIFLFEKY